MIDDKPVRAAVIGLGVGERHAVGYARNPYTKLVALCDLDRVKMAQVVQRLASTDKVSEVKCTTQAADILDDPTIDVVSIATFDDTHASMVVRALGQGKHVMVEKPVVLHPDELWMVRRALDRSGKMLTSNLILRTSPRFIWLRNAICEGRLGEIFYMEGDYVHDMGQRLTKGWRQRLPFYCALMGGGIHVIDLLLWLTGADPYDVCVMGSRASMRAQGEVHPFHETITLLMRTANDMLVKSTTSLTSVHPHFHDVRVHGTRGTFMNRLNGDGVLFVRPTTTSRDGASVGKTYLNEASTPVNGIEHGIEQAVQTESGKFQAREAFEEQAVGAVYPGYVKEGMIDPWIDAILGKSKPLVEASEVFKSMAVCLAGWQALSTECTVRVQTDFWR